MLNLHTPTQTEIRQQYEQFGREQVAPQAPLLYEQGMFDFQAWEQLCAMGLWRIPVPEQYGGMGLTWWEFVAAFEGLAKSARDLGFMLSLVAHCGLIRAILEFGTEEQRRRYLPPLMQGKIGATAITEVTGGSDVARIETFAVRLGGDYVLQGDKCHITNAPIADLILVLGRVPELGARDISLFLLERGVPGLEFGQAENMFGNRTSPTGPMFFRGLHLWPHQVVGTPGNGLQTIYNIIALDRVLYGVLAAGYLEPILADAMQYARQRTAFKSHLIDFQYVQGRLTDIKIAMESVRWVAYAALDLLIQGHPDASALCSIAKLQGAEALCQGTQHAMQIFGHLGYVDGPIAKDVRDALGTRIAGGTPEMQRKNIINQLLKQRTQAG